METTISNIKEKRNKYENHTLLFSQGKDSFSKYNKKNILIIKMKRETFYME